MGNFISNFQTTEELAAFSATSEFIKPHVSLTKDDEVVHFFKIVPPIYRWVDDGYTCVEYDKYLRQKQQVSIDDGSTWEDTGLVSATTLVEHNSEYCGYVPPETRVIAVFETTSDNEWIYIIGYGYSSNIESVEVDGETLPYVSEDYTFEQAGEHIVKYTLVDNSLIDSFYGCNNLKSVTIPDSVTSIGQSAFYNCYNLSSITIPSGVTSISHYAFYYCSGLNSITVNAETPPTLGSEAFNSTNNCPIYTPNCSYKSASGWSDYSSRIFCPGGSGSGSGNGS